MRFSFAVAPVLAFAFFACSHADQGTPSSTGTSTSTPTGSACASLADTCAAGQQGCVEDSAGAHCEACPAATYASPKGTCEKITGTPLSHDFPDQTVMAGQEITGLCRSWTMNNETEIWMNASELQQSEDSHHSNFTWVPDTTFTGPDGIWPCGDRKWDIYSAVAVGGLVFAQSTQATHGAMAFAAGAAVRIPPHARIISDIHLLNTSTADVTGHATLTLYQLDAAAVSTKLSSWHVEYDALNIPPHASARFTGRCSVAADVKAKVGTFAPKLYYLLPHTHTLETAFTVEVLGGKKDGTSLLDLGAFNGEPHGKMFDPPVDISDADGVTFACQYRNTRDQTVGWGFGANEMCELFGFAADSPYFQSRVNTGTAAGTDGEVQLFDGDCVTDQVSPLN